MATKHIKKEDLKLGVQIGSGGFSTVYKATLNGQEVAVKQLHTPNQHEADVLETLEHPHIVKFIGALEEQFNSYLVLELCEGGSLRSYLDRKRFDNTLLPIYQKYDWAEQAIKPIQYLRARNLVHKDIKSANYLIADGNILKLADFGITKSIENTIQNATQRGTLAYGSPELLKDCILSPSYDISAYGVVLWEMCTTLVPFQGLNHYETLCRICNDNGRPTIDANCPKPLADLMIKCWDINWKKRPHPDEILKLLSLAKKQEFIAGPWKCEKEFGQQELGRLHNPTAVAVNPANLDVAVIDPQLQKVLVYHSTGEFKFSILHQMVSLYGNVAVSQEGNYYTTDDTRYVHCYNQSFLGQSGVYKRKWVAVSCDRAPLDSEDSKLRGLAIDHTNNLLLVGVVSHSYISKHHLDGTHVNSIKVNIIPCYLSVTTHDTIIVGNTSKTQIVDQTGETLHTLEHPSHRWPSRTPRGVCCHEGIIFRCNYASQEIFCYSMHGDYLGSIPIDIKPWCITFVPGQKKFLVSGFGSKTVRMYSCQH